MIYYLIPNPFYVPINLKKLCYILNCDVLVF